MTVSFASAARRRPPQVRTWSPSPFGFRPFAGVCCLLACWLVSSRALAAVPELPAENQVFQTAVQFFQERFYDKAQQAFGQFVAEFPQSRRVSEAILMQAQSLLKQGNHEGAVTLLAQRGPDAGELRDQFLFWQAETEYDRQNYSAAATNYARLLEDFPQAARRLEASYGEAFAHFKMTNAARAIELLSAPAGAFQTAALNSTNEALIVGGRMLLAEAYFTAKDFKAADQVLKDLGERPLNTELNTKRLFLLAVNAVADKRPTNALEWAAASWAAATNLPVAQASALSLRADIFRESNPEQAVAELRRIYQTNGMRTNQVHAALFKMVDILTGADRIDGAILELINYVARPPNGTAGDEIRLKLGDLYLKKFLKVAPENFGPNSVPTNTLPSLLPLLANARAQYRMIITNAAPGAFVGKASLQEAWSYWHEAQLTGFPPAVVAEAARAFTNSFPRLPVDEDQAVARIKFADCLYLQQAFTNAIKEYEVVLGSFGQFSNIRSNFFDQCLYQVVRAYLELGDLTSAAKTRARLVNDFPRSSYAALSLLTIAQSWRAREKPEEATTALQDFLQLYPDSTWMPRARLELARTYVDQSAWASALAEFATIAVLTNSGSILAQSEFERGQAYDRSGSRSNAFALYTNFVVRFASNPVAPLAQLWIANAYMDQQDYRSAEESYQKVLQFPRGVSASMTNEVRLLSARAALKAFSSLEVQRVVEAKSYLEPLIEVSDHVSSDVSAQALFMMADAALLLQNPEAPLSRFTNAISPLGRIIKRSPPNEKWIAVARVRLGEIWFQLGGQSDAQQHTNAFAEAITHFEAAIRSPAIEPSGRSEAEVGLGQVKDWFASGRGAVAPDDSRKLLAEALEHYLRVFNRANMDARKGEQADSFWVMTAGIEAAKLASKLGQLDQAIGISEKLLREFPNAKELEAIVKPRLADLKERLQ